MTFRRLTKLSALVGVLALTAAAAGTIEPPRPTAPATRQSAAATEHVIENAPLGPLYVDEHATADARAVILLFHQGGGSARGEYDFLIPDLLAAGFSVYAADLHGGGDRFGAPNRTIAATPEPADFGYCDAGAEMAAVIDFVDRRTDLPMILWGSSYSAALVIRAAAERGDDIAAVLAFSPASGEPMAACEPLRVAGDLTMPALAVRPQTEMEIERVAAQLEAFADAGVDTYVSPTGSHGSSVLHPERGGEGSDDARQRVFAFLGAIASR